MTAIFPTHTAFDDALDLLGELVLNQPSSADTDAFLLVHAIVAPGGEPLAHAWVETDGGRGLALWYGIQEGERRLFATPAQKYREDFKVREELCYTAREAWAENVKAGNYGPWTERHRSLCGRGNRIMGAMEMAAARLE